MSVEEMLSDSETPSQNHVEDLAQQIIQKSVLEKVEIGNDPSILLVELGDKSQNLEYGQPLPFPFKSSACVTEIPNDRESTTMSRDQVDPHPKPGGPTNPVRDHHIV